jgi:uncharacterized protein (TIGR02588 family)
VSATATGRPPPAHDHGERGGNETRQTGRGRTTAEWVSFGLSLAILAALVGSVVYLHLTSGDAPPAVEARARPEAGREVGGAYYLPIEVVNTGDRPAEQVRVRVDVGEGSPRELEIDRLPGGATRRATVVLRAPPAGEPTVEVVGFVEA